MSNEIPAVPAKPPMIPLVAKQEVYTDQLTQYRNMLSSCLRVTEPADIIISALGVRDFADSAKKNNNHTPRPSEAVVGLDATERYLYLIPVRPKTVPGAIQIKYRKGRAYFTLYQTFARLDRLVPFDMAEYYDVLPTPGEVTIESVKGWGVYIDLQKVTKESIQRLSEEEKAARAEKRRQTVQSKNANREIAAAETEEASE